MIPKREYNALLHALKRLRSRIVLFVFQNRMNSYQKKSSADIGHDITASLSEQIDKLAFSKNEGDQGTPCSTSCQSVRIETKKDLQGRNRTGHRVSKVTSVFVELSKYFKKGGAGTTLQPHVSEKLKTCTWEHIHTALRLARQGEVRTARLYAEIANNALKEAAHYMSEEEYAEFTAAVEEELNGLMGQ